MKLHEATRTSLIAKSRKAKKYSSGEANRWDKKSICSLPSEVKDYNNINMDTFWKKDLLIVKLNVKGQTGTYLVTIQFDNILERIQRSVKNHKNEVNADVIYSALIQALNESDIKVECDCSDFKYRFAYAASKNDYKAGDKESREAKVTNPDDDLGAACKHVLFVLNNAQWVKKIASVINNYISYGKEKLENLYAQYIFPKVYGMPYEKAVQLTIDDFDEKGNLKTELDSSKELINLANALGKTRGRFVKGSNRNPAAKKPQPEKEPKEEPKK